MKREAEKKLWDGGEGLRIPYGLRSTFFFINGPHGFPGWLADRSDCAKDRMERYIENLRLLLCCVVPDLSI